MARDDKASETAPPGILATQASLVGEVSESSVKDLLDQLNAIGGGGDAVTVEVTTLGGDAEFGRRAVLEIDLARERLKPRRLVFLGKTVVYSAGVTIMSAFPREDRYLTSDAMLLIHCRQLEKTVQIQGPIRASLPEVESLLHQMKTGIELEKRNFERLIEGSRLSMDMLFEKALYNWYLTAQEALELGLVAGIVHGSGDFPPG